jgi:deoxyribodipyrimidine photo-lyase
MAILMIFSYSALRLDTEALNKAVELANQTKQDILPIFIEDANLSSISSSFSFDNKGNHTNNSYKFYSNALHNLNKDFFKLYNANMVILSGDFEAILSSLLLKYNIKHVFTSVVYELKFLNLYKKLIANYLKVDFHFFNDSLLHTSKEILNRSNEPYQIFTPFYNNLIAMLKLNFKYDLSAAHTFKVNFVNVEHEDAVKIEVLQDSPSEAPSKQYALKVLDEFIDKKIMNYKNNRDIPSIEATSSLSPYLRFGILDIKFILSKVINITNIGAETFIKELIWREFAYYVAYYFPHIIHQNHKPLYNNFKWDNNENLLQKFKAGLTGYPIVDAGITELTTTGNMHNRVRMIVASFLIKNLNTPWQIGAEFFKDYLIDYDETINAFSWQWVAGCGFDASPYFRVFNPKLQNEKFDPNCLYIKKYLPSLSSYKAEDILNLYDNDKSLLINYVDKIVDFKRSREDFLAKIIK